MLKVVHEFLRWLPVAIFGGALAIAGVWDGARDWIAAQVQWAWSCMSSPLISAVVIAFLAAYIWAVLWTGRDRAPASEPPLSVDYESVAWGGRAENNPDITNVTLILTVSNVGQAPLAIKRWAMLHKRGDRLTPLPLAAVPSSIKAEGWDDPVTYDTSKAIFERTVKPIEGGAFVRGYLESGFSREFITPEEGDIIRVEWVDVRGVSGFLETVLKIGTGPKRHYPGLS